MLCMGVQLKEPATSAQPTIRAGYGEHIGASGLVLLRVDGIPVQLGEIGLKLAEL